jgi:hypothetical protein
MYPYTYDGGLYISLDPLYRFIGSCAPILELPLQKNKLTSKSGIYLASPAFSYPPTLALILRL